jgi:hypothetical protein
MQGFSAALNHEGQALVVNDILVVNHSSNLAYNNMTESAYSLSL